VTTAAGGGSGQKKRPSIVGVHKSRGKKESRTAGKILGGGNRPKSVLFRPGRLVDRQSEKDRRAGKKREKKRGAKEVSVSSKHDDPQVQKRRQSQGEQERRKKKSLKAKPRSQPSRTMWGRGRGGGGDPK